jgi:beta-lactamase class A
MVVISDNTATNLVLERMTADAVNAAWRRSASPPPVR